MTQKHQYHSIDSSLEINASIVYQLNTNIRSHPSALTLSFNPPPPRVTPMKASLHSLCVSTSLFPQKIPLTQIQPITYAR
jgi:hypothetical protein